MMALSQEAEQALTWVPNLIKGFHSFQAIHSLLGQKSRMTSMKEVVINPVIFGIYSI